MPTATYIPLQTITLSSTATTVTFGSIPNSYKDLVLVINAAANSAVATVGVRFNSDSGNNYSWVSMVGNGSSATSSNSASTNVALIGYTLNTTTWVSRAQVMDYSATDKHKTILSRTDNAGAETTAIANRWASTSAVTSLQVSAASNSFASGSTFSLYGIAG